MGDPSWAVILPVAAAVLPSILLLLLLLAYIRKLWRAAQSARESELVIDQREAALLRSARMASLWRASRPVRAFNWSEHPSHVMTAVEHGWAAFAFSYSAPPATWFSNAQLAASHQYHHHHHHHQHLHQQVSMWGLCHACANSIKFREPENTWNTGGAGEYMQQIRLNPGVTRLSTHHGCVMPVQAVQTAMPLPGPTLGPCPYPQESYFEVSILAVGNEYSFGHSSLTGSERCDDDELKGTVGSELTTTTVVHVVDSLRVRGGASLFPRVVEHADDIDWDELLAIGLAAADAPPFRLPGFEPSSIGFLSADGQCYVNGQRRQYGGVKTIVGCGFEPRKKKVYFTINGELIHEATLKGNEFGKPLYPTLASNFDVTLLVNLGQSSFHYMPANVGRIANPSCQLLQSITTVNDMYHNDGADLFSMGQLHSHWLSELEYANSPDFQHHHVLSEAESDLFEIVLDGQ
ncbi:unnamed protein product, partial [Sphagnum troendelagicum]